MLEVYVIRHGETVWNAEGRIQGHRDSSLTSAGREHAEAMARRLQGKGIQVLYTSSLGRALNTAGVLSERLGIDLQPRVQLRECGWGAWEGMTWEQLRRDFPRQMQRRQNNLFEFRPPGGESYKDGEARVRPFVNEIQGLHQGDTIAVVGHNMINRVLMRLLLGISFDEACQLRQDNHHVYQIRLNEEVRVYSLIDLQP